MQKKLIIILLVELAFAAAIIAITLTCFHTHQSRSMIVGLICIVFNILMYASPLTVMVSSFLFIITTQCMHHTLKSSVICIKLSIGCYYMNLTSCN